MSLIPYSRQEIADEDIEAVVAALRSEYVTQGPRLDSFEQQFAYRHQVAHAVAVCNATAALHISCLALGVGPGTLVWTTPNTFLASANCARYCGADVDFVDIDPATRNMSTAALHAKLETARGRGRLPQMIVPVDFAGLPCDLREMRVLADEYGFRILEDASHATGASYLDRPVGSAYADVSVFSFHAVKIVTTAEGGIAATQDASLAHRMKLLRSHGMVRDPGELRHAAEGPWVYEQQLLGFNYRLTDLQAALGESQLRRLDTMHRQRIDAADRYDSLLAALPLILPVRLPDRLSSWHLYAVEIDDSRTQVPRARVFDSLRKAGIGVNVHYIPVHTQPYYAGLGFRPGDFPAAERYYARAISLPLFPGLSLAQQERVAAELDTALQS